MLDHYPPNLRHDIDNQKISVADTKHDAEQHGESVKAKRSSSNGKQKSNTGTEKSTGPPGLKRRPTVAPYMPPKGKFTGTTETKEKLEPKEKPIITLTKTIENLTLSAAPAEFQLQNKQDNVSCSELIGERGINNQSTVAFSEEPPGLRNGNGNTSAATPSSTSTKVQQNVTSQEKDRLVNTNDAQPDDFDHDDWASEEMVFGEPGSHDDKAWASCNTENQNNNDKLQCSDRFEQGGWSSDSSIPGETQHANTKNQSVKSEINSTDQKPPNEGKLRDISNGRRHHRRKSSADDLARNGFKQKPVRDSVRSKFQKPSEQTHLAKSSVTKSRWPVLYATDSSSLPSSPAHRDIARRNISSAEETDIDRRISNRKQSVVSRSDMSSSWGKKSQSPEKRNENSSSASKRTSLNLQDTPENSRQFRSGSALRQRNTSADVNDTYITLDKARYADLARRVDSNSESSPNPEANSNRLAGASNSESHSGSPLLRTHPILYPAQDQETSETSDHRVSQADGKNISEARLVKQDLVKHDHRTQADSKNFSEVRLVKPDDSKRSASFLLGKALASKAKKPDQAIFVPKRQLEERAAREKAAAEKEEKVRLAAEQKNREYIEAQVAKRAAESDHSRNLSKMNGWGRSASPARTSGFFQDTENRSRKPVPMEGVHVLEVMGIRKSDREEQVLSFLLDILDCPIKPIIKWADSTHALAVYSRPQEAYDSLKLQPDTDRLWLQPYAKASSICRDILPSELQPPTLRPKTTSVVARRLLSSALQNSNVRDVNKEDLTIIAERVKLIELALEAGEKELRAQRSAVKLEKQAKREKREKELDEAWGSDEN